MVCSSASKATVIHPASDKHIGKYETKLIYIVEETPDLYQSVTYPYLKDEQLNLQVTKCRGWSHKNYAEHDCLFYDCIFIFLKLSAEKFLLYPYFNIVLCCLTQFFCHFSGCITY